MSASTLKQKLSDTCRRIAASPYTVYIGFFLILLVVYRFMYTNGYDDMVSLENLKGMSVPEAARYGYAHGRETFIRYWYSVIYTSVLAFHGGILWRPLIAGSYVVSAICLHRLFPIDTDTPRSNAVISCCGVLLFPLVTMSETGWFSTSVVYIVPVAILLAGCLGLKHAYSSSEDPLPLWRYISFLIAFWFGCAHEQLSALMFGLNLVLLFYTVVIARKKVSIPHLAFFAVALIQTWRTVTWAGNTARISRETNAFFPEYLSFGPLDKLYLGFQSTMHYTVASKPMTLFVLSLFLILAIFSRYKDRFYRALSMIPAAILFVFGFGYPILAGFYSNLGYFTTELVTLTNFVNIRPYFTTFVYLCLIGIVLICIYLVFGNTFASLLNGAIFLGGLCTRFIMGFSASVYMSGYRTALIMFFCMIIVAINVMHTMKPDGETEPAVYTAAKWILVFFGSVSYIDMLLFV